MLCKLLIKNITKATKTYFDHCKLTNVKLYLNSEFYSYDYLNLDFDKYKTAVLYNMICMYISVCLIIKFLEKIVKHYWTWKTFFTVILTLSLTARNKTNPSRAVNVQLKFAFKENVLTNTTAYCLIIHDRVIEYVQRSTQDYVNYHCWKKKYPPPLSIQETKTKIFCYRASTVSKSRSPWLYQHLRICKDLSLKRNLSWRKWRCWEKEPFSLITFLRVPCHEISWQNQKSIALPGLVLITMEWEDGMIPYSIANAWL